MSRLRRVACLVFGHEYELRTNPLITIYNHLGRPPPLSNTFICVRCGHESTWSDGKP